VKERKRWRDFVRWVVEKGPIWKDRPPKGCDIPPSEFNALFIEAKLQGIHIYRRLFQGKRYTVYYMEGDESLVLWYYSRRTGKNG
jgi:hypothetical protein